MRATIKSWWCAAALALITPVIARADVLLTTNGERFVGKIISETADTVLFESEMSGRLTVPRANVRELQRTSPAETAPVPVPTPSPAPTNAPPARASTNTLDWRPPGIGRDGSDWVQLRSGEWLRGQLKYVQDKEVEFDSDELEEQTLKLKDVRMVYTAHRVMTKFEGQEPVYGRAIISNQVVIVQGAEDRAEPLELLTGITPGGAQRQLRYWSGKANVGLTVQSGNNSQTTMTTSAELARRTPNSRILLDYLGNYSKVNSVQSANNDRATSTWDIWLNRRWFVRPVYAEYYYDPLANISRRLTGGVGAGYSILDDPSLEWRISAGPAFQYTKFETVEAGQSDTAQTPAAVLQSNFEIDITRRLTFIQTIASTFTKKEAGQYTHHAVTTLEFEIKRHLNLDVSFVWDFLKNPQVRSDGTIPEKSDYYLTVGLGVRF